MLPKYDNEPQFLVMPMSTTMGWVQSPPTFCVMSDTICNQVNTAQHLPGLDPPKHQLESYASPLDDLLLLLAPRPKKDNQADANLALTSLTLLPTTNMPPRDNCVAPPLNRPFTKPLV